MTNYYQMTKFDMGKYRKQMSKNKINTMLLNKTKNKCLCGTKRPSFNEPGENMLFFM
jgi:hypothetical protein